VREDLQGLSSTELDSLLNVLVLDNVLERKHDQFCLKKRIGALEMPQGMELPCDTCKLFDACAPGGVVSPQSCRYFVDW
jgi:hypothetical protein